MRIVIDARMYGLEHAGIGRYVVNLINKVAAVDKKNEYFVLLRKVYYQKLKFKNKKLKKILADYSHYSLAEQVLLPLQLFKLKPDLVHFPHFNVPIFWWGKQVVTIHDLIKHQSRGSETTTKWQLFYWFKYLNYRFLVWLAVKKAAKIIVPCRWWKGKLTKQYKLPPEKIVVTYEGISKQFRQSTISNQQSAIVLAKYKVCRPFIIYTGNLYPHKNVERLAEAIVCLNDSNNLSKTLCLVVVCSRNVFYERFKKKIGQMRAERFVELIGFVPDEELVALYRRAEAFVMPSLMEGFGLPGLEAMASGCPVLASSIPVFKEVYREAALYFNPLNVGDIAEKIKRIISNKLTRNKLIKRGYQQAKRYSWQKMAKETLMIYESLVSP